MSDEPLQPALNAQEWDDEMSGMAGNALFTDDVYNTLPRLMVADIAALNFHLPDDSPYKITRADVDAVRDAQDFARANGLSGHGVLDSLAAKLEAILPPVPDRPPAETT